MKSKHAYVWHMLLIIAACMFLYPLVYMVFTSFKTIPEIFSSGLKLIPTDPTLDNYKRVMEVIPLFLFIRNSLIVATIVMIAKIISSITVAYAVVFMDLKYKEAIFYAFTLTMFIPFTVTMLPNFITLTKFGLLNTLLGVSLPQLADAMGIFRIRQAMRGVPKSLVEAARIDNVHHTKALLRIVLPLIKPAVVAMCIFFFIDSWNQYFWPMLILRKREVYTITLSMKDFLSSEGGMSWGSSIALATLTVLPPLVLYIFAQRYIISTFLSSGLKE